MNKFWRTINFQKLGYYALAFAILSFAGLSFYFFGILPRQIRHDCSWVRIYEAAIPAKPAKTVDELKAEGLVKSCAGLSSKVGEYFPSFGSPKSRCEEGNKEIIEEYKVARPEIIEKVWYRKASDKEYDFCLRDKGLIK